MLLHADVVSCVHPVAVLNVAFCMTFNAGRGCNMEEAYSRAGLVTAL